LMQKNKPGVVRSVKYSDMWMTFRPTNPQPPWVDSGRCLVDKSCRAATTIVSSVQLREYSFAFSFTALEQERKP
jgi:hypothetical protein